MLEISGSLIAVALNQEIDTAGKLADTEAKVTSHTLEAAKYGVHDYYFYETSFRVSIIKNGTSTES